MIARLEPYAPAIVLALWAVFAAVDKGPQLSSVWLALVVIAVAVQAQALWRRYRDGH